MRRLALAWPGPDMNSMRVLALCLALLLVPACSDRPPWADGRVVREERPAGAPPETLVDLRVRLLAVHNRARGEVRAPPLDWDNRLADAAAVYARRLAGRGNLVHSPAESRPGQGENLWMGTRGAFSLEEMSGSWADEKSLFRPGIFPGVSSTGKWSDVAHYTQMIWRGTASVGCAVHRGAAADVLVCRYSPPGNVVGQRVP